ncbi:hypothetical protein GINT2_000821 [Glugoides intestinalis]
MESESFSDGVENDSYEPMNEFAMQNLHLLREKMLKNYIENLEMTIENEINEYDKYSVILNVKETVPFENDSEDMGVREDLELLDIK